MKKIRKILTRKTRKLLKLTLLTFSIILSGCNVVLLPPVIIEGEQQTADCATRTEIIFSHLWPMGNVGYPVIKEIINSFNNSKAAQKYNVCVKGSGTEFWSYFGKIDNAISGGTAGDIFIHTLDNSKFRARSNILQNIDELIAWDIEDGMETWDLNEVFYENQLEAGSYDGIHYGLPMSSTVRVIYYNKELWAEAGLDEDDIPTTWEELKTISKKLTTYNEDGSFKTIGFDPLSSEGQHFQQWVWADGKDFWVEENGKMIPKFNTQEIIDVMENLQSFPNRNEAAGTKLTEFMAQFSASKQDPFASGKVAMSVNNEGAVFTLRELKEGFDFGVFAIPAGPNKEDGISVNWSSSFSIELYNNDMRPGIDAQTAIRKERGAWEFLKFFMNEESQRAIYQVSPFLVSRKDIFNEVVGDDQIMKEMANNIQYAIEKDFVPTIPKWHEEFPSILNVYYGAYHKPTSSEYMTTKQAFDKIQDLISAKIKVTCGPNPDYWGC